MEEIFRGDTFEFDFSANLEGGEVYSFEKNEILKAGLKSSTSKNSEYLLFKKIEIIEQTDEVHFEFVPKETETLPTGIKILEVELTDLQGKVKTIYQEEIEIKGDVVNGD